MKQGSLDFGVMIAYAIPGALALAGLAHWQKPIHDLFAKAYESDHPAGALSALLVLSVVAGMIISVLRASTLDHTFETSIYARGRTKAWLERARRLPIIGWYARRIERFGFDGPIFEGVARHDPKYVVIAEKKRLEVLREAITNDKRPYQFYGNTIVAIIIYVALLLPSGFGGVFSWDRTLRIVGLLAAVAPLLTAARTSYGRFMSAVAELNEP